jgi:hypothetical protein
LTLKKRQTFQTRNKPNEWVVAQELAERRTLSANEAGNAPDDDCAPEAALYRVTGIYQDAVDALVSLPSAQIKATSSEVGWPRTNANDGDDGTHWSANPGGDVQHTWWAADLGDSYSINSTRIYSYNPAEGGFAQDVATEVRLYGTNDDVKWADLTNGSGKISDDMATDRDWTLVYTHTTPLTEPSDSGLISFSPSSFRYWFFHAISGGSSEWDVNTFELWYSPFSGFNIIDDETNQVGLIDGTGNITSDELNLDCGVYLVYNMSGSIFDLPTDAQYVTDVWFDYLHATPGLHWEFDAPRTITVYSPIMSGTIVRAAFVTEPI